MDKVVTIAERDAREAARRRSAADAIIAKLKAFAISRGGRFLVFGSAAVDAMSSVRDLAVVVHFPSDPAGEAVVLVEDLSRIHDLPVDYYLRSLASERFLARIANEAVTLS